MYTAYQTSAYAPVVMCQNIADAARPSGYRLLKFPPRARKPISRVYRTAPATNAVIAPVSSAGTVCFASSAQVDLVVDVNGWFE